MEKTIERKITPKQIAWLYIKNLYTKPFFKILYIILKICGIYLIVYSAFDYSSFWYGIFFIMFIELFLMILYIRIKLYYKALFGKETIVRYNLYEDKLIYSVSNSSTIIIWDEITYVKIRKKYISVKKGKATILSIHKSSDCPENFNIIKDYINHLSYTYTFGSDTK